MIDRQFVNGRWLRIYRRSFTHGRDIGASGHVEISIGRLRMFFERAVGLYGFPNTVSYSFRFWLER